LQRSRSASLPPGDVDAGDAERAADDGELRRGLIEQRPTEHDGDDRDQIRERRQAPSGHASEGERPSREAQRGGGDPEVDDPADPSRAGVVELADERRPERQTDDPGVRVTTANLDPDDAERLADAIADLGRSAGSTYTG
jgi:hypothetical protein